MDGWVNVGRGKDWVKIPRKSSRQLFIVFIIEHPMTTIIMRKNRQLGALRHLKRQGLKNRPFSSLLLSSKSEGENKN